jgi:hypothetical protein
MAERFQRFKNEMGWKSKKVHTLGGSGSERVRF